MKMLRLFNKINICALFFALASLDAYAAAINFSGQLDVIQVNNGGGVYSGTALGTNFFGAIDDVTASGNISDGTTLTSFSCCIAAGGLAVSNDLALDAETAALLNTLLGSSMFSEGDLIDGIDIEGDEFTSGGGRIEVGLSYIFDASTFIDDSPANYPFDPNDVLLALFFIFEEDATGGDVYSGVGKLDVSPVSNDVVLNLPNPGVSVLLNDNTSSVALHPDTAEAIAVGDVDGNGIDDVIVSFPAGTGPTNTGGTWISRNQGALALLSPDTAEEIVAGDFTGTAGDELFMDFGGSGLWASVNGGAPFIATGLSPVAMAVGDVDNNGQDDLIFSITGLGTLVFKNLSAIAVLDVSAAQTLATGDVDGNGAADVIAGFRSGEGPTNAGGTWISRNEGALASLSPHKAEPAIAGDFDGNGEDDLFLDFDTNGLWASLNDSPPFLVVNLSPVAMAAGDLDNNGQDDLIFSLTGAGTLAFKNLSTLAPLDSGVALDLATGNVDGN